MALLSKIRFTNIKKELLYSDSQQNYKGIIKTVCQYLIMFLIATLPFYPYLPEIGPFNIATYIQFVLIAAAIPYGIPKIKQMFNSKQAIFMSLFLLWITIETFILKNGSWNVTLTILGYGAYYYLIIIFFDTKKQLRKLLFAVAILTTILVILSGRVMFSADYQGTEKIFLGHDRNEITFALIFLLPPTVALLRNTKSTIVRVMLTIIAIGAIGILMNSQSRAGFLGLLMIAAIFIWVNKKSKLVWYLLPLAIFLILITAPQATFDRLSTLTEFGKDTSEIQEGSIKGRIEVAIAGIKMFQDNPTIGVGVGNFESKMRNYMISGSVSYGRSSHNRWIDSLAENGILGFAFLLSIMAFGILSCIKVMKSDKDVFLKDIAKFSLITLGGAVLFFNFLSVGYRYIFIITGLVVSLELLTKQNIIEKKVKKAIILGIVIVILIGLSTLVPAPKIIEYLEEETKPVLIDDNTYELNLNKLIFQRGDECTKGYKCYHISTLKINMTNPDRVIKVTRNGKTMDAGLRYEMPANEKQYTYFYNNPIGIRIAIPLNEPTDQWFVKNSYSFYYYKEIPPKNMYELEPIKINSTTYMILLNDLIFQKYLHSYPGTNKYDPHYSIYPSKINIIKDVRQIINMTRNDFPMKYDRYLPLRHVNEYHFEPRNKYRGIMVVIPQDEDGEQWFKDNTYKLYYTMNYTPSTTKIDRDYYYY